VKEGKGKFKFSAGGVYEGDYVNNEMNGEGTFTFPDGSYY
jgi:hypothetical protein